MGLTYEAARSAFHSKTCVRCGGACPTFTTVQPLLVVVREKGGQAP